MGGRFSTHQKRVSSRLHPSTASKPKNTIEKEINSTATDTGTRAPSNSSQSSDSIVHHGRKFHNEQTSTYWFPNDDEELDRLVGVKCFFFFFF
jgi:hypothetical protein